MTVTWKKLLFADSPAMTGTPTAPTAADNTSTTQVATTAFAKSQDAVLVRVPNQAVNMTNAASGSSGIVVADNDNIDFGTGSFTLVWRGSLPDWTPAVLQYLLIKWSSNVGYYLGVSTSGAFALVLNVTGFGASISPGFVDGTVHEIVAVATVGAVNTTVDFYCDGVVLGTQATAANAGTLNNASALYALGTGATRCAGTCAFTAAFNRALSASEVLDLYRNGISFADKWGSQAAVYTSDFSAGLDSWSGVAGAILGNIDGIGGQNDWLRYTNDNTNTYHYFYKSGITTVYKRYRVSLTYYIPSTNSTLLSFIVYGNNSYFPVNNPVLNTATTISFEVVSDKLDGVVLIYCGVAGGYAGQYQDPGGDDVIYLRGFIVTEIGATLALEPEGIQSDYWYDSSTNALNATYPAAGSSLTRNTVGNNALNSNYYTPNQMKGTLFQSLTDGLIPRFHSGDPQGSLQSSGMSSDGSYVEFGIASFGFKFTGMSAYDNLGQIFWRNIGNSANNASIWARRGGGNYGSASLVFETATADSGTTERMRITDTGNINATTGNIVISTSGKGIDFSATSDAAGMTSELLDDYEVGTWTPGIAFGGATTGISYTTQSGTYVKVGSLVTYNGYIVLSSKGSATGSATVTGLPYTNSSYASPTCFAMLSLLTYTGMVIGHVLASQTNISVQQETEGGTVSILTNTNFSGTTAIGVSGTYRV